jgi:hypothetical protein
MLRETWKFMAMCVITVNLKQIFRHVDATLPKYLIRQALSALLGPCMLRRSASSLLLPSTQTSGNL